MKLTTPHVTIQNTDGSDWQVTVRDLIAANDGMETITFIVLVPRSQKSLPAVTRDAVQRAAELLQIYLDNTDQ